MSGMRSKRKVINEIAKRHITVVAIHQRVSQPHSLGKRPNLTKSYKKWHHDKTKAENGFSAYLGHGSFDILMVK